MISDKTLLLAPEGLLDEKAVKVLIDEIALSRMPRAVIDCSGIDSLLAEAVIALKRELDGFRGGYVEIELKNLKSEMALQFQLYDFPVEEGVVRASTEKRDGEAVRSNLMTDGVTGIICRQCYQALRVHSSGLHACPGCGSKLYVDPYGRTKYYEPLRLFRH